MSTEQHYIQFKIDGSIFPTWIMKNFKQYKIPSLVIDDAIDPCNTAASTTLPKQLKVYQEFIGKYMSPNSPYHSILLYHGMGSGKTTTAINIMNVFHNYNPSINLVILIKASLHNDPWIKDMNEWLVDKSLLDTVRIIHYDSPYASQNFMNEIKQLRTGNTETLFFFDEVHNFIKNVYSNKNSETSKRASTIYDYIVEEMNNNTRTRYKTGRLTRVIAMSATPAVNIPFELGLLFNMLRPNIFPNNEDDFNRLFISTHSLIPTLRTDRRNMFIRRITGLVSYYIGATPDLYARKNTYEIKIPMTEYQYRIYRSYEKKEQEAEYKAKQRGKRSQLYKTYTRQASNFVLPRGLLRPRKISSSLNETDVIRLETGALSNITTANQAKLEELKKYYQELEDIKQAFKSHIASLDKQDTASKHTILDDVAAFGVHVVGKYDQPNIAYYYEMDHLPKSRVFTTLYECSPKMTNIACLCYLSRGKTMIYSNYVLMEGLAIMKIYLGILGFDDYTTAAPNMGYCEYHGGVSKEERIRVKEFFNKSDNIRGTTCKIILLSPSATEGIQLLNIVQEHILEKYWNNVRTDQVVGRGIRQCSHRQLPKDERQVDVYYYLLIKPEDASTIDPTDTNPNISTDEIVSKSAQDKTTLLDSFQTAIKESAIDCELFKAHNMLTGSYQCFNFSQTDLLDNTAKPAYKESITEDLKYDIGLFSPSTYVEKIQVIKITAVMYLGSVVTVNESQVVIDTAKVTSRSQYWYNKLTHIVYDPELHYPVGKVIISNDQPYKLDKDTYVISDLVKVPTIPDDDDQDNEEQA